MEISFTTVKPVFEAVASVSQKFYLKNSLIMAKSWMWPLLNVLIYIISNVDSIKFVKFEI